MRARGAYFRLMGAQAEEGAQSDASLTASVDGSATPREIPLEDVQAEDARAHGEPTDAILRAEGLGWTGVFRELLRRGRTVEGEVLGRPGAGDRPGRGPDRRRGG